MRINIGAVLIGLGGLAGFGSLTGVGGEEAASPRSTAGIFPSGSAKSLTVPTVEALVRQLGAPDYRLREQAAQQLEEAGPAILPQLRQARRQTQDLEIQRRLETLIARLERSRLLEPTRLTAQLESVTAEQAIAFLARHSGYAITLVQPEEPPFDLRRHRQPRYNFRWDNTPFWQAVDQVTNAGGGGQVQIAPHGLIQLIRSHHYNPFCAYTGPFRCVATNIQVTRSLLLEPLDPKEGHPVSQELTLSVQVCAEPKVPLLGLKTIQVVQAIDDEGHQLSSDEAKGQEGKLNDGPRGELLTDECHELSFSVLGTAFLPPVSRTATHLKRLKLRVWVRYVQDTLTDIVIDEPHKAVGRTFRGRRYSLGVHKFEKVEVPDPVNPGKLHQGYRLSLQWEDRLQRKEKDEDVRAVATISAPWQLLELSDTAGRCYYLHDTTLQSDDGHLKRFEVVLMPYPDDEMNKAGQRLVNRPGPPARLVLYDWVVGTHPLTFEFKNLPLP
ncbi:MAG: hypothetical protein NZU63_03295 [Gemmataceae bacterium]|nr:hypothetical protein [Gemmataceae bacterium]MDW8243881.1 hypothetical protein [Thermogemmata sp.]